MTHAKAVAKEMERWWRLDDYDKALVLAFCACVAMKMKGKDMDDLLANKPRKPTSKE